MMIRVRSVLQTKWGTADEVAAALKEGMNQLAKEMGGRNPHILTDLSGPFHRVVEEIDVESLAHWEQNRGKLFSHPEFAKFMARVDGLIESGYQEFFTIES
jgi:hypothetical protein